MSPWIGRTIGGRAGLTAAGINNVRIKGKRSVFY
jgi:hypothetical protein